MKSKVATEDLKIYSDFVMDNDFLDINSISDLIKILDEHENIECNVNSNIYKSIGIYTGSRIELRRFNDLVKGKRLLCIIDDTLKITRFKDTINGDMTSIDKTIKYYNILKKNGRIKILGVIERILIDSNTALKIFKGKL